MKEGWRAIIVALRMKSGEGEFLNLTLDGIVRKAMKPLKLNARLCMKLKKWNMKHSLTFVVVVDNFTSTFYQSS